ncbi:TPA: transcriptional regulator [Streptococcus suis]|uniref:transcriptional regulator n=1 Tax=Streptococcus suis TaxID=1307 RepID=UPI00129789CF|nr:transcriptional regulator [Streptococcus suis]HEM3172937.1 transcriptional regulator [Streptococcus suis]HEM4059066.1 transcriptional regulator [Streptococcus suis]
MQSLKSLGRHRKILKIGVSNLTRLDKRELSRLDSELNKYRSIDRSIRNMQLELSARNSNDEMGIRSGGVSKPTEAIVIKWDSDPTIRYLEAFKTLVEKLLDLLTDEDRELFHLRWEYPCLKWEEIADKKFMSLATIYRRRAIILEQYAELKGHL